MPTLVPYSVHHYTSNPMLTEPDNGKPLADAEWERTAPGPLWSWWLAEASDDGPGLRRWQLWIWWTRRQGLTKQFAALTFLVRGVIEAPYEVWGGVRRFGKKTRRMHGVALRTQYRDLLSLRWRFGIRPESYYRFQLFRPDRKPVAQQFIQEIGQLLQILHRRLPRAGDEGLFLSKKKFRQWCENQGLPTVDDILEVNDGKIVARATDQLPASDLFVKPTNWRQGRGVSRWHCIQEPAGHHYIDKNGTKLNPLEMESFICRTSLEQARPYIVQRVLKNHRNLLDYTNGALATVRLMTVRRQGENAQPLVAVLRMPTGDSVADNFDGGGVAAPIDLNTGSCGPGLQKKGAPPPDVIHTHPDTKAPITELTLPFWSECLTLTCRAHDLIKTQVPVIGWDVAILEDGPVLVEPNHLPCEKLAQMPGGFPLGNSPFAEVVVERLREAFLNTRAFE